MRTSNRFVLITAAMIGFTACTPILNNRGNSPDPDIVATIKPGVQTRTQVATLLGTPSNVSTFDDKTWYYISRKTETVAFFKPEAIEQKILKITFDDQGVVKTIDSQNGTEKDLAVSPLARVTPTAGNELTVVQQLLGDIGRVSPTQASRQKDKPGG